MSSASGDRSDDEDRETREIFYAISSYTAVEDSQVAWPSYGTECT